LKDCEKVEKENNFECENEMINKIFTILKFVLVVSGTVEQEAVL